MAHYHLVPEPSLHLRDPANSVVGRRILSEGLVLMNELGLEAFTFKKLAARVHCTEVTIYRYFPNKQRLLQFYFQLYWLWLGTVDEQSGGALPPRKRLHGTIRVLCGMWPKDMLSAQLEPEALRELVVNEGSKSFLHKNVDEDNGHKLFKPYKDLIAQVAAELKACAPWLKSPLSFATTLVEMAHSLEFAMHHLPALTELSGKKDRKQLAAFLNDLSDRYLGAE